MLDGFAMDDVKMLVIRAMYSSRAACVAPVADRKETGRSCSSPGA
jgi:hypothetical protein